MLGCNFNPEWRSHFDIQETSIPNGPVPNRASTKLQPVSDKNPGLSVLNELSKVLTGKCSGIPEGFGSLNIPQAQICVPNFNGY